LDGDVDSADKATAAASTETIGNQRLSGQIASNVGATGHQIAVHEHWLARERHRIASIGKWSRRDPLGMIDGVNLYSVTAARPLYYLDPFGQQAVEIYCPSTLDVDQAISVGMVCGTSNVSQQDARDQAKQNCQNELDLRGPDELASYYRCGPGNYPCPDGCCEHVTPCTTRMSEPLDSAWRFEGRRAPNGMRYVSCFICKGSAKASITCDCHLQPPEPQPPPQPQPRPDIATAQLWVAAIVTYDSAEAVTPTIRPRPSPQQ